MRNSKVALTNNVSANRTRGTPTPIELLLPSPLLFVLAHQPANCLAQQRSGVGAQAVNLTVGGGLAAVGEGRLFVPLPLRDDVADLVVGPADHHPVWARQFLVDSPLPRG